MRRPGRQAHAGRCHLALWQDPRDTNIRIAPSYPTVEDLEAALDVLVLAVKLVAAELARAERA